MGLRQISDRLFSTGRLVAFLQPVDRGKGGEAGYAGEILVVGEDEEFGGCVLGSHHQRGIAVIDIAGFLNALNSIGCDAPARCEPFNAPLRAMPPDQALQTTITAMRKAFALIA